MEEVCERSRNLITADEPTIVAKSLFDATVVKES